MPPPHAARCGNGGSGVAFVFAPKLLHPRPKEAVPLWLATKHKYPAGQACGILESRRLERRIVRAARLVKELAPKYPLNRRSNSKRPKAMGVEFSTVELAMWAVPPKTNVVMI